MFHRHKHSRLDTGYGQGVVAALPVALGYLPTAIAFGLMARSQGIPASVAILMSLLVFAGAAQFMGIQMMALGASAPQLVLATFLLNLRHLLMSAFVSQKADAGISRGMRALISFGITDETFAVAAGRAENKLNGPFMLALNVTSYLAWVGGTIIGLFIGQLLPMTLQQSLAITLYALFIALLVPLVRQDYRFLAAAVLAAGVHCFLRLPWSGLSPGWSLVIAIIVAATVGALIFPGGEEA